MTPLKKPGPHVNSGKGNAYMGSALGKAERPRFGDRQRTDRPEPTLKRTTGPKPSRGNRQRPGGPDAGMLWHQAVHQWIRSEHPELSGLDLATLEELRPGYDMHHIVEASSMWHEWVDGVRVGELEVTVLGVTAWAIWHPYAGFPVNVSTHGGQTSRMKKIPRDRLLPEHLAFVAALDALVGVGWASSRITRAYS